MTRPADEDRAGGRNTMTRDADTDLCTPVPKGTLCEWFVLCENDATHYEPHPVLELVPCCDRCAGIGA